MTDEFSAYDKLGHFYKWQGKVAILENRADRDGELAATFFLGTFV